MESGTEVGSIYYELDIDDENLEEKLDRSDKAVAKFGENVEKTGESLKMNLNKAAAGFAIVGTGLTLISKQATDFTVERVAESRRLSREIGTTIEEASSLTAAFSRMGLQNEQVSAMFGVLSKNIIAGAEGFNRLSISLKNADGTQRQFRDVLFDVADKVQAMPDGIQKTALVLELFGRSGKDLIPILNQGSAGIQQLQQEADKLGLTLTADTIESVNKLSQSKRELKQSTDALKIAIGTETSPILTSFNTALNDVVMSLLNTDGAVKGLTIGVLAFGGPILGAAAGVLTFTANLVTAWPAITRATAGMWGLVGSVTALQALSLATWALGITFALASVAVSLREVKEAFDAVSNAEDAAANIANEGQMRTLQQQATAARQRGDTAEVNRIANALRAMGGNDQGTSSWKGGLTWVHERGGEIIDLPRGSRVIPHDLSEKMINKQATGNNAGDVHVTIGQVNDRSDADYILRRINRDYELRSMGVGT
jgi:hypothetical protein